MLGFITENFGSLIVGAVVLAVVVLIVVKMVRGGKKSFCSCGDCSSCGSCGNCSLKPSDSNGDNQIVIKKAKKD